MNCLRHPIQRDIGQQFVSCKPTLHVAVTVGPIAKFLEYPGGQASRGIVQGIGDGLRLGSLQMGVSAADFEPSCIVLQKLFFRIRNFSPG